MFTYLCKRISVLSFVERWQPFIRAQSCWIHYGRRFDGTSASTQRDFDGRTQMPSPKLVLLPLSSSLFAFPTPLFRRTQSLHKSRRRSRKLSTPIPGGALKIDCFITCGLISCNLQIGFHFWLYSSADSHINVIITSSIQTFIRLYVNTFHLSWNQLITLIRCSGSRFEDQTHVVDEDDHY